MGPAASTSIHNLFSTAHTLLPPLPYLTRTYLSSSHHSSPNDARLIHLDRSAQGWNFDSLIRPINSLSPITNPARDYSQVGTLGTSSTTSILISHPACSLIDGNPSQPEGPKTPTPPQLIANIIPTLGTSCQLTDGPVLLDPIRCCTVLHNPFSPDGDGEVVQTRCRHWSTFSCSCRCTAQKPPSIDQTLLDRSRVRIRNAFL